MADDHRADADARLRRTPETRSLAAMLDALPSLVAYVDADGRNRYVNAAALPWLGHTPRQAAGMRFADLLGDGYEASRAYVEAALAGTPQHYEQVMLRGDGRVVHTQSEYLPRTADGRPDGFYVLVTDITRRVEAEAGQQAAVAQRALLEERNRLAADLHDQVMQRLFAAGLQLDLLRRDPTLSAGGLEATIDALQGALEELRTSVRGLAQGNGLSFPVTAIEQVLLASRSTLGTVPELVVRGDLGTLPETTVRGLLAALAEVLAGVGRKQGVGSVLVAVAALPGAVELRVTDDGATTDEGEREADLAALDGRIRAAGGRLSDRARPRGGSTVRLLLPFTGGPADPVSRRTRARPRP